MPLHMASFCCEHGYFLFDPDGFYIMAYAGVDKARMVELLGCWRHRGCTVVAIRWSACEKGL